MRNAARSLALSFLAGVARSPKEPFLRALYFHGVPEEQAGNFASLLERLKFTGEFVSTQTFLSMLEGQTAIDGRYFHLSFDDGHRSLVKQVAPLLLRLRIPALMFVATGPVGVDGETVSWDDLKWLGSQGFEIGSHTRTHRNLASLASDGERDSEIAGSKREIEARLDSTCRYFAWPYGRERDIDEASFAAISRAGYEACFSGFRGSVRPGKTDRFRVPRHHLEADWPWPHVRYFSSGHGEK